MTAEQALEWLKQHHGSVFYDDGDHQFHLYTPAHGAYSASTLPDAIIGILVRNAMSDLNAAILRGVDGIPERTIATARYVVGLIDGKPPMRQQAQMSRMMVSLE
jgi:hypothetical protein